MAWSFGDGFDLYAAIADMANGYWDSVTASNATLVTGRFPSSQAFHIQATTTTFTKNSGVNDAVHHLVVSFRQTSTITGSTSGAYLQLLDGSTGQCAIVFRSDGAILLTSGTAGGTTLATYTGAFPVVNTWYAFEFEVVVNNTTGSFTVRKNGNTSNDFSATSLNTRGGTANNYANKLTVSMQAVVNAQEIDDLFWRSDASSVAWMGDVRCFTRMPASDSSVQFTQSSNPYLFTPYGTSSTFSAATGVTRLNLFTSQFSGTIGSATIAVTTGGSGHMKAAIYDGSRNAVLGTSNEITNPVAGSNTVTFSPAVTVTHGTNYYFAVDQDFSMTYTCGGVFTGVIYFGTITYASFPTTNPAGFSAGGIQPHIFTLNIATTSNADYVNEAQQDTTTTYVYDGTIGHADLYGIASIGLNTPSTILAVTTRGYMIKSDAGSRGGAVQLKSGSTTVASSTVTLTTSGWQWAWRTDTTDPNTGSTWTASNVNNVTIGPTVIS